MARFHDESTGKWFNCNSDCAACWLGHDHDFDKHLDMLADFLSAQDMNKALWMIKGDAILYEAYKVIKAKHFAALKTMIQLYDKFSY